ALEAAGSAKATRDDAARLLPVFRIASLQAEARRGPARGPTAMGPYVETTESATPTLLVLPQEPNLVRTTLCSVDTSSYGLTALRRVQPGEPVAGNPLGGFCEGGRAQAAEPQDLSLPTIISIKANWSSSLSIASLTPESYG